MDQSIKACQQYSDYLAKKIRLSEKETSALETLGKNVRNRATDLKNSSNFIFRYKNQIVPGQSRGNTRKVESVKLGNNLAAIRKLQETELRVEFLSLMYVSMKKYEATLLEAFKNAITVYESQKNAPLTQQEEEFLKVALMQELRAVNAEHFLRDCLNTSK